MRDHGNIDHQKTQNRDSTTLGGTRYGGWGLDEQVHGFWSCTCSPDEHMLFPARQGGKFLGFCCRFCSARESLEGRKRRCWLKNEAIFPKFFPAGLIQHVSIEIIIWRNILTYYVSSRRQAVKIECFRTPTAREMKQNTGILTLYVKNNLSKYIW